MMIWDELMSEDGAKCSQVLHHVVVELIGTVGIHRSTSGEVHGANKREEIVEEEFGPFWGFRRAPKAAQSNDQADRSDRSPLVRFQLPVRRAAEVPRGTLHPRWEDGVGDILPYLFDRRLV